MQSPTSSRAPAGILCNPPLGSLPNSESPSWGRAGNNHVRESLRLMSTLGCVRRSRVAAIAVAAVLIAGCAHQGGGRRAGASSQASAIPSATTHPATIHPVLVISGIIAPYQNVTLSNNLSEPAAATFTVNEGDHVRRGEVIAVLDTSDLQAQLEAAEHTAGSDESKATQSVYTAQQTISRLPNGFDRARSR